MHGKSLNTYLTSIGHHKFQSLISLLSEVRDVDKYYSIVLSIK